MTQKPEVRNSNIAFNNNLTDLSYHVYGLLKHFSNHFKHNIKSKNINQTDTGLILHLNSFLHDLLRRDLKHVFCHRDVGMRCIHHAEKFSDSKYVAKLLIYEHYKNEELATFEELNDIHSINKQDLSLEYLLNVCEELKSKHKKLKRDFDNLISSHNKRIGELTFNLSNYTEYCQNIEHQNNELILKNEKLTKQKQMFKEKCYDLEDIIRSRILTVDIERKQAQTQLINANAMIAEAKNLFKSRLQALEEENLRLKEQLETPVSKIRKSYTLSVQGQTQQYPPIEGYTSDFLDTIRTLITSYHKGARDWEAKTKFVTDKANPDSVVGFKMIAEAKSMKYKDIDPFDEALLFQ